MSFPLTSLPSNILIPTPLPLFKKEAPIDLSDREHDQAFQNASDLIRGARSVETLDAFMVQNPNFDLNTRGPKDSTIMSHAIEGEQLPLINRLLELDPTLVGKSKPSGPAGFPYVVLAARVSVEAVQAFLQHGADVNITYRTKRYKGDGITALYISSLEKITAITKFLLLNGAVMYQVPREEVFLNTFKELANPNIFKSFKECALAEKVELSEQIAHIHQVIQEIKQERRDYYLKFRRRLHCLEAPYNTARSPTKFSSIPPALGDIIMSFLPGMHRRMQFLSNCDNAVRADEASLEELK